MPFDRKKFRGFQVARVKNQGPHVLYIYDEIGPDYWTGEGIEAKRLVPEIDAMDPEPGLHVRVNSPGGIVSDGIAIFNALERFAGPVDVFIDGIAASISSVIALGGDKIHMAENARFMIHSPWTFAAGNSKDLREVADQLDKTAEILVAAYGKRTGIKAEEIRGMLEAETWFNAQEALEAGFVDSVGQPEKVGQYDLARYGFNKAPKPPPAPEPVPDPEPEPEYAMTSDELRLMVERNRLATLQE